MSKEKELLVDDKWYEYGDVVRFFQESDSFRLNFVEMMLSIMLDAHDIALIQKLNLVANMAQLIHFREHFIESLQSFYMKGNYHEEDFDLICSWQKLVGELIIGMEKGTRCEGKEVEA
jgi:hypothetical protein